MKDKNTTAKYPEYILKCVRQRHDLEANNTSQDKAFQSWSKYQILNDYLIWNGILGYTDTFISLFEDIYGIELKEDEITYDAELENN